GATPAPEAAAAPPAAVPAPQPASPAPPAAAPHAANADATPAPQLDPVVVTAKSLDDSIPGQLSRYGVRVNQVSSEQIQNAGYVDVAQSLQTTVPGLYLTPRNGPFDYVNVSLQGSRTQDVLWLLDGVRLNNRLYGGTTPLDTFPASIVDHLEVLEGPQALFYGTQGVAGAVNVVTKPFSNDLGGAVALGTDTLGGRHLDAFVRDGFHGHQVVVYGSSDHSTGFQPFRDQDYQPSSTDRHRSYDVLTLGGKYAYQIRDDLRVSALYQHTDGRLDFALPYLVASAYNRRQEDVLTAKVDYAPSDAARFSLKGYYHKWRSHYTEFDNVAGSPNTLDVSDNDDAWGYKDYGLNALAQLGLGPWLDSNLGYDFQSYSGSDAVLKIDEKTEHVNALFAQLRTSERLPNTRLALGFRYNLPSFGPNAAVWNASGQYNVLGQALFVRSTVGTAFRLPTAEELFANDPEDERGNPNLKPERSFNVNASVGGQAIVGGTPRLSWEAIFFARNVTDLISASGFDDTTNQSLFENTTGKVRVRGATAVVEARPLDELSVSASFTYSSARQNGDLQTDGVPQHLAKAWLDYHPSTLPFGLTATANHVGSVYKSFGEDDREKFGNYTVFDLAGRLFLDQPRHHTINLRLANVFNTEYATALGKATADADGSAYTYWHLGTPRTLEARYRYSF
ncbi:MAG: TonB-dependent receptor, partial [Polyangiaceae bacterium]